MALLFRIDGKSLPTVLASIKTATAPVNDLINEELYSTFYHNKKNIDHVETKT